MSKLIDADTDHLRLPRLVRRDDSDDLASALRVAGEGAVALAQGSTTIGLLATRKGLSLAKELVVAVRKASAQRRAARVAAGSQGTADRGGSAGRTTAIVAAVLGVLAVGGVAFYRTRRPAHPPIAPEPPRVRPAGTPADETKPAADSKPAQEKSAES